ncbi:class I adenylate-forming enzyme family protein [Geobacillus thermodenitrificans]|uniref:class I adenylate-forming enzyme family protein n=1 Tax=Geobacillus thermodenitrificans TaxID=33940 RepID=UPI000C284543|nr:AMP-binding protein [Geobacillus thermodenitrificans]PJW21011.1 AMP-dependent synthetase [Geobacillus thermodenitrificans]
MPNMAQDIVEHAATRYGEKTALIDGEHVLSFVEVNDRSLQLAERLRDLGVQKGDAVAVQLPNSWEFVVAHLALARLGAIMVPVNLLYRQKELSFMFSFAHVKAVIAISEWKGFDHAKMMESLRQTIPTLQHIIIVGERKHPDHYSVEELLTGNGLSVNDDRISPDDPMIMMFTSGTESDPKAVIHTYETFIPAHLHNGQEYGLTADDVMLCLTPMSHMFSLPMILMGLYSGAVQVMLSQFSVERVLDAFSQHAVTFCVAAPTHLIDILRGTDETREYPSTLRLVLTGGTKIPAWMVESFRQRFRCKVAAQWGMTEIGAGSFTRPNDAPHLASDTVGRPCPMGEISILDENQQPLPNGQVGEIAFRGRSLFKGYYKNEAATQQFMTKDGFFLTGDLGWKDEKGYLHYVSRKKDIINRGGLKVHAAEIEEVLLSHPHIRQAAVIAVPDERLGERGCAIVSLKEGTTFSLEDMQQYLLKAGMAKYKLPEYLKIVGELPTTASGKVSKGILRKQYVQMEHK